MLFSEHWDYKYVNTPVDYVHGGGYSLGLLQRPEGKRHWVVLNVKGEEERINMYQIKFQFPFRRDGVDIKYEKEEIIEIEKKIVDIVRSELIDAKLIENLWNHFLKNNNGIVCGYDVARYIKKDKLEELTTEYIYACHRLLHIGKMYFKNHHHIYFKCLSKQKIYDEKLAIRETFKAEKELITFRKKIKAVIKNDRKPKKS